jgi:hypothetical protein
VSKEIHNLEKIVIHPMSDVSETEEIGILIDKTNEIVDMLNKVVDVVQLLAYVEMKRLEACFPSGPPEEKK